LHTTRLWNKLHQKRSSNFNHLTIAWIIHHIDGCLQIVI
jgi:hypothetical protein